MNQSDVSSVIVIKRKLSDPYNYDGTGDNNF